MTVKVLTSPQSQYMTLLSQIIDMSKRVKQILESTKESRKKNNQCTRFRVISNLLVKKMIDSLFAF